MEIPTQALLWVLLILVLCRLLDMSLYNVSNVFHTFGYIGCICTFEIFSYSSVTTPSIGSPSLAPGPGL